MVYTDNIAIATLNNDQVQTVYIYYINVLIITQLYFIVLSIIVSFIM